MSSLLLSSQTRQQQQQQHSHNQSLPSSSSSFSSSPAIEHHTSSRSSATPDESIAGPSSQPASPLPASQPASQDPQSIWQSLTNPSSNPLLSAGFSLMIFGAALSIGRKGVVQGVSALQRRMLVSLEIPSKDKAHGWLLQWMDEQSRRAQSLPQLSAIESLKDVMGLGKAPTGPSGEYLPPPVRIYSRDLAVQTEMPSGSGSGASQAQQQAMTLGGQPVEVESSSPGKASKAQFSLVPGPGTHYFRYRNVWFRLQRERNAKLIDMSTGAPWETLTLTTLYSSRYIFPQLLAEAEQQASSTIEGKTILYTAWGVEWRVFGQPRKARRLDSVILQRGQRGRLVEDVSSFLQRGDWYARRGIPYRRGYLLHGAPGSGKTSIIQALAGELGLNICLLNLSERGLTDDKLNYLLSIAPERSVILLEDIDAAFPSRVAPAEADKEQREYQTSVTFSGLLNALDGVASTESRIVFMTTNHVERLDPALIRPGRVDLIEELGDANEGMVREMFQRFYSGMEPSSPSAEGDAIRQGQKVDLGELTERLVNAVSSVSTLRRKELGLDSSGRYPSRSQQPSEAATTTAGSSPARTRKTKVSPLPAQRGGVSMAELQGLLIRHPEDPLGLVEEVEEEMAVGGSKGESEPISVQ